MHPGPQKCVFLLFVACLLHATAERGRRALQDHPTSFVVNEWHSENLRQELIALAVRYLSDHPDQGPGVIIGASSLGSGFDGTLFTKEGGGTLLPIWSHNADWRTYKDTIDRVLKSAMPSRVVLTAFTFQDNSWINDESCDVSKGTFSPRCLRTSLRRSAIGEFSNALDRRFLFYIGALKGAYGALFSPSLAPAAMGLSANTSASDHSMRIYDEKTPARPSTVSLNEITQKEILVYGQMGLFDAKNSSWDAGNVQALADIIARLKGDGIPLQIVLMPMSSSLRALIPTAYGDAFDAEVPEDVSIIRHFDRLGAIPDSLFRDNLHVTAAGREKFTRDLVYLLR